MKILLVIILIIVSSVLWLFAVGTKINEESNNIIALIIRTIAYWIALIFTGIIAFYLGKY